MKDKIKCHICLKDVNININEIPPQWFGSYCVDILEKAVCADCNKTSKEWWRKNEEKD